MRQPADRSSRRALAAGLGLALALGGLSCSDKSDIGPGSVRAVRIVPDTLHVLLGRVDSARAFPIDQDNAFLPRENVAWATTDGSIATVDARGVVTGVALGTTQITATTDGITGTGTIVVDPAPVLVFTPDTARIAGIAGSSTPANGSDTVSNGGGGGIPAVAIDSITYVSGATGWLQATLAAPSVPTTVDLVANTSAVPLGRQVALVWFTAPNASPTTGSLPVVLTTTADVPASVTRQAGQGQTATVNTAVAVPPSVLVRDQFNNPVAGIGVTFAPTAGSGTVTGGSATTNASGIATVGSWTLGTTAGGNTLNVTVTGLGGAPLTFSATGLPGQAANIAINAGNNQAAVAGQAVGTPPSVLITDAFGNAVTGTAVTFAVATGGGSITGANPVSNASGVAAVGSWTLGPTAGPNTLTATSGTLNGSPVTFTATGNPGNATDIALISGNAQSGTVNTALAAAYVVKVTDINGNAVQGVTVGWAPVAGGGSMNPPSSITDASGLASSTRTLGTTAGTQTAAATVTGLNGSPVGFTATANPGNVATIAVNGGNNQSATVNTAVATAPSVVARDAFNNVVPGAAITFTVTAGGGSVNCGAGAVAACAANTNGSGIATLANWTVGTVSGTNNNAISATRAGATGTSFVASATAGAVASVAVNTGNNQNARPGASVATAPTVVVRDAFNNLVPNATVAWSIIAGGGTVNCGAGATTACNTLSNGSGVAAVAAFTTGSAGLPTVAAPANGRYINTLRATSNALSADVTGFAAWDFNLDVQPIFTGRCIGCHFTGGTVPNLSAGNAYAAIRGVNSGTLCGFYVATGFNSSGSSWLLNKIASAAPCGGLSQMPADGTAPLPTASINIIRDWINNNSPASVP